MLNSPLTLDELSLLDQEINAYLYTLLGSREERNHFPQQLLINAGGRCFEIAMIIDLYEGEAEYKIFDIVETDVDTWLDALNT